MSEQTKDFRSHFYLAATLGLVAIVTPVITGSFAGSVLDSQRSPFAIKAEVRQKALLDRAHIRAKNRAYVKAANNCVDKRATTSENIHCPDVNDESSYVEFLTLPHGSANIQSLSSTSAFDRLSTRDQTIIQQSVDAGNCSERLISRGLYRLCKRMLQKIDRPHGFINDKFYLEIDKALANPRDLRTRIRASKNPRGTTTIRRPSLRKVHYQAK